MSLQVWLPLNGNLNNQGLSNYTIDAVRGSIVYNDSGKIGKCFYAHGVNTLRINNIIPDFYNYSSYSLCAWFYIEAQNTTHSGSAVISAGNWNAQVLNLALGNWSTDHYTTLRISGTSWSRNYAYNFFANQWYHVVVSSDGTSTKAYVNGVLINDTAPGFLPTSIEGNDIYIGGASYYSGMQFFGRINDVRIYDHALSAKEVREIAKGLVLHYKLDDEYTEGTTNYLTANGSCANFRNYTVDAYATTVDSKCAIGNYIITYSLYLNNTSNVPLNARCSPLLVAGSYETFQGNAIPAGSAGWSKVTCDLTDTSKYTGEFYPYIQNGSYSGTVPSEPNFQVWHAQAERNNHQTGWVLGGTTRAANTTIYDTSGFGYNGTPANIVISKDTARYSNSFVFNGSSSYIKVNDTTWMANRMPAMTINLWAKSTAAWNANTHFFSCTEGGGFNTESGNSGYLRFPISVYTADTGSSYAYKFDSQEIKLSDLPVGEWVMLTWVYDNFGTRTYINGELHHTYLNNSYGIHFNTGARLFLGCEANTASPYTPYFNGQMSDFRLYATALTEEDIRELYQTSACIDKQGGFYSRELVE